MRINLILVVTLILFLIVSPAIATNYYIFKNATGNNNGTSWVNAWKSFSNINWSIIQPGDNIYISGGTDSTIYNETLIISNSGSVNGGYITISNGIDPQHNGRVIISPISGEGIQINRRNYVIVKGFEIRNPTDNKSDNINIENCGNVKIDSMNLTPNARGIYVNECNGRIELSRNKIITVLYSTSQTDCIYSQRNREIIIWGNHLEVKNEDPEGHNDCIQSFEDGADATNANRNTFTAYNNLLFQNNSKQSNSSATMLTYGWGWFTLFNNIVIQPNSYVVGLGVQQNTIPGASNMKARIWNNTLIAGEVQNKCIYLRRMSSIDTVDVANNIIYTSFSYGSATIDDSPNIKIKRWDYNRYYSINSSWTKNIIGGNRFRNLTLTEWQKYGFDLHSSIGDPKMVNPLISGMGNYSLSEGSPLIDHGTNLSEYFNFDKTLNLRPNGAGWDIGAFEHTGFNIDLVAPELVNAALIDSVTLELEFSEALNTIKALDKNNYLINPGITVNNANISDNGNAVILSTSVHQAGVQYQLKVFNLTDMEGNLISSLANTYDYKYINNNEASIKLNIQNAVARAWYQSYVPENSIDGATLSDDPSSRWGGARLMPDTIIYDLGQSVFISKAKISFFRWDVGRVYKYSILVGNSTSDLQTIVSNVWSLPREEWITNEFSPIKARYLAVLSLENNESNYAGIWETEIFGNSVTNIEDSNFIVSDYILYQNYPNPFNPSTDIRFTIPQAAKVAIKLYNVLGENVANIVDNYFEAGSHSIVFDGINLAAGVYFYRLESGKFSATKKMLLIK
jgi:hypothetical protein